MHDNEDDDWLPTEITTEPTKESFKDGCKVL